MLELTKTIDRYLLGAMPLLQCGAVGVVIPSYGKTGFEFTDYVVWSDSKSVEKRGMRAPPKDRAHELVFSDSAMSECPIVFQDALVEFRIAPAIKIRSNERKKTSQIVIVVSRVHSLHNSGAIYFTPLNDRSTTNYRFPASLLAFVFSQLSVQTLVASTECLLSLPSQNEMLEIRGSDIPTALCDRIKKVFGASAVLYWQRTPTGALFHPRIAEEGTKSSLTERDRLVQKMLARNTELMSSPEDFAVFPKKIRDWATQRRLRGGHIFAIYYGEILVGVFAALYSTQFFSITHTKIGQIAVSNLLYATIFDQFSQEQAKRAVVTLHDIAPLIFAGLVSSLKVHDSIGLLGDANIGLSLIAKSSVDQNLIDSLKNIRININNATENCKSVMKFTDFSRFQFKTLKLQPILEKAISQFVKTIYENDIDIIKNFDKDGIIQGDPDVLEQVFANIISNSIYFLRQTPPIESRARITIILVQDKEHLVVLLRDNGPGIPKGEWERVFEFLHTTKGPDGTGVGLSMARLIVEHHGGTISIADSRGAGTTVRISLPLQF